MQANQTLKHHHIHIQPHWMFALDNLLRAAVQAAILVISPGKLKNEMKQQFCAETKGKNASITMD